jgi:hypothetical protein
MLTLRQWRVTEWPEICHAFAVTRHRVGVTTIGPWSSLWFLLLSVESTTHVARVPLSRQAKAMAHPIVFP